jgi:hypothetical protein
METPNISKKGSFATEMGTASNWITEPDMSGPLRCASSQSGIFQSQGHFRRLGGR